MNDDLIRAMAELSDALQEAYRQIRAVIERFAQSLAEVTDILLHKAIDPENKVMPNKKWKPVRVIGCKPKTTVHRKIHRTQRR